MVERATQEVGAMMGAEDKGHICLKCGAGYGGRGQGHCTQWYKGMPCGGHLKRDDQLTEEDWEQLRNPTTLDHSHDRGLE